MRTRTVFTLIALFSVMVFTACGGTPENEEAVTEEGASMQMEAMQEQASDDSPQGLAEQTFKLYMDAIKECTEALTGSPESAVAIERVTAIRDKYAEQLIAIGKKREALDAEGKTAFDRALYRQLSTDVPEGLFENYQEVQRTYSTDPVAGRLTNRINIITQYTNFELLSKQEPEEAKKYGVYQEPEE